MQVVVGSKRYRSWLSEILRLIVENTVATFKALISLRIIIDFSSFR